MHVGRQGTAPEGFAGNRESAGLLPQRESTVTGRVEDRCLPGGSISREADGNLLRNVSLTGG